MSRSRASICLWNSATSSARICSKSSTGRTVDEAASAQVRKVKQRLAGLARRLTFSRGLAEQDALDGRRDLAASFLPVDALDEGFGAGRLSVVHTALPGVGSYRPRAKTHET